MNWLSRLNPAERRLVLVVGVILILGLNYALIWPHFSDWGILQRRLSQARTQRANYEAVIQKADRLKPELTKLKGEAGDVLPEEQALKFVRTLQDQAIQSGVGVDNWGRQSTSTNNPFFIELSQTISVQSGEKQLVDFLFKLGDGESMVRVRSLSLHPDVPRQKLAGSISLIASYQKKLRTQAAPSSTNPSAARPAAAAPTTVKPGTKPAALPPPAITRTATNSPTPKKK